MKPRVRRVRACGYCDLPTHLHADKYARVDEDFLTPACVTAMRITLEKVGDAKLQKARERVLTRVRKWSDARGWAHTGKRGHEPNCTGCALVRAVAALRRLEAKKP